VFERIERSLSAVQACAKSLRAAILDGSLAVGERLPAERRLAERFGVNRVTVRSALGKLEAEGLVSVRQGSGYVVRDFRRHGGPELLVGLADLATRRHDRIVIAGDLLHVRRHLARAVLERLVEAPADSRASVSRAIESFIELAEAGASHDAITAADMEVLAALLESTGSAVLALCMNPVLAVVTRMPLLREALYREPRNNALAYRLLLAWLAQPDPAAIEPIIRELEARDDATLARLRTSGEPS